MFDRLGLLAMALLYVVAGVLHFLKPRFYLRIMPPSLPSPLKLVYLSGVAEIFLGLALLVPALRSWAAWGIIALLMAVFPANIYMYQRGSAFFRVPAWLLLLRLPLQFALMAWAYSYT